MPEVKLTALQRHFAWGCAELGLCVEFNKPIPVPSNPHFTAFILVHSVMYPKGTVILTFDDKLGDLYDFDRYGNELLALGYGCSMMGDRGETCVGERNAHDFAQLFSEWGWAGDPDDPPSWLLPEELC